MVQNLLNVANVGAAVDQCSGEGMPEHMRVYVLCDAAFFAAARIGFLMSTRARPVLGKANSGPIGVFICLRYRGCQAPVGCLPARSSIFLLSPRFGLTVLKNQFYQQ